MEKKRLSPALIVGMCLLGITSNQAFAADECGTAIAGGVITCDGDGSPVTDINPYASGISYTINGLTLNLTGAATNITANAVGVHIHGTGNNPITTNLPNTLSITTSGGGQHDAVRLRQTGTGAVTINSAATILTTGPDGDGLLGWIDNPANSQPVTINASGSVETRGGSAAGIFAYTTGTGNIDIASSANVTTKGTWSDGVSGWIDNPGSTASISLAPISGNITTENDNSPGISIYHAGQYTGTTQIVSTADIDTSGTNSHGIVISPYNSTTVLKNSITTTINVPSGSITTTDASADGILSDSSGLNGSSGTGTYQIDVGATVSVTSPGKAIHTVGSGGGTINTAATISGDIITDVGDDILNWTAGTLNGEVHLGNGSDVLTISSTGYNGTEILDGGDDTGSGDGMIDVLTFKNIQVNIDGSKLTNWEKVVLDNATVNFTSPLPVGTQLISVNQAIPTLSQIGVLLLVSFLLLFAYRESQHKGVNS